MLMYVYSTVENIVFFVLSAPFYFLAGDIEFLDVVDSEVDAKLSTFSRGGY